ncbi:hypothetical protein [Companilactobacillus ginsenosidimutans]|uniref:Uncharacterized protein n=1 Tax=Companilactobacillus ginsenosidimutans TaxID=1007676 RepID=A0A0H4QH58_9LACO|nr:hypothetical protein [Companilactobacillus ginsenosidimutans]AKP67749.1 hypothetical protein ABM34_09555 [Companilactobacillus ginsenosidimutans]
MHDKYSSNKLFVFGSIILAFLFRSASLILYEVTNIPGALEDFGWPRLLTAASTSTAEAFFVAYILFSLPMIRENFPQKGTVIINLSITYILGAIIRTVIIFLSINQFTANTVGANILLIIVTFSFLAWQNWTYIQTKTPAKQWVMGVTLAAFIINIGKLFIH